jgi:hypothetical protein
VEHGWQKGPETLCLSGFARVPRFWNIEGEKAFILCRLQVDRVPAVGTRLDQRKRQLLTVLGFNDFALGNEKLNRQIDELTFAQ